MCIKVDITAKVKKQKTFQFSKENSLSRFWGILKSFSAVELWSYPFIHGALSFIKTWRGVPLKREKDENIFRKKWLQHKIPGIGRVEHDQSVIPCWCHFHSLLSLSTFTYTQTQQDWHHECSKKPYGISLFFFFNKARLEQSFLSTQTLESISSFLSPFASKTLKSTGVKKWPFSIPEASCTQRYVY